MPSPRRFESAPRLRLFRLSLCFALLLPPAYPAAQGRWRPSLPAALSAATPAREKGGHRAGELLVRFRRGAPAPAARPSASATTWGHCFGR